MGMLGTIIELVLILVAHIEGIYTARSFYGIVSGDEGERDGRSSAAFVFCSQAISVFFIDGSGVYHCIFCREGDRALHGIVSIRLVAGHGYDVGGVG